MTFHSELSKALPLGRWCWTPVLPVIKQGLGKKEIVPPSAAIYLLTDLAQTNKQKNPKQPVSVLEGSRQVIAFLLV